MHVTNSPGNAQAKAVGPACAVARDRPPSAFFFRTTARDKRMIKPSGPLPHATASMGPSRDAGPARRSVLALPSDVSKYIVSILPIESFPPVASVCSSWAQLVRAVIQLNRRTAEGYVQEGLVLMKTSNSPWDSLALFRSAIVIYPRLIEAYFWEAKALFILNDEPTAVKTLERALCQQPSPVESLKLQACILYANSNDQHASQLLEAALLLEPNDASIHFELGFCYHGLQHFSKAIKCYTTALELNYHRAFVVLANRANCLFRNERIDEALDDLKNSLAISPHYELALRTRAFVNLHLGNSHAAYQDYTTIIEHATDAKVKSDALCNRAFCYGDMDEDDIEMARAIDPTNLELVQYKASALVNSGNLREAISHVTQWMESNKTHKDRACQYAFRGELHAITGDWDAGIRDYETAIEIVRTTPAAHLDNDARRALSAYRERLDELKVEQLEG